MGCVQVNEAWSESEESDSEPIPASFAEDEFVEILRLVEEKGSRGFGDDSILILAKQRHLTGLLGKDHHSVEFSMQKLHPRSLLTSCWFLGCFWDRTKGKSGQSALHDLKEGNEFRDKVFESTKFVYKLGLSQMHPCMLMNGLVYGPAQVPLLALG